MTQVPDLEVPLETSGLPKSPNLAHHLEKVGKPDHIDFAEMAEDNKSEEIVEESCHIKCDRLYEERYLLIDFVILFVYFYVERFFVRVPRKSLIFRKQVVRVKTLFEMVPKKGKNDVARTVSVERQAGELTLENRIKHLEEMEIKGDRVEEIQVESMEDRFKDETRCIYKELEMVRGSNACEAEVEALQIEVDDLKEELLNYKIVMTEWGALTTFLKEHRHGMRLVGE
ncbi:hypothetical protein V6N13_103652 [Hibiscus sabdariffa]